jgi:glycoprotein-N-acetylgalactosamine 3-beta-galactosyltransferase
MGLTCSHTIVEIAAALERVGINTTDTRDSEGRQRFLGIGVDNERMSTRKQRPDFWLWRYSPEAKEGRECCSKKFVSSHYALPDQMRYLDDAHDSGCEAKGKDAY